MASSGKSTGSSRETLIKSGLLKGTAFSVCERTLSSRGDSEVFPTFTQHSATRRRDQRELHVVCLRSGSASQTAPPVSTLLNFYSSGAASLVRCSRPAIGGGGKSLANQCSFCRALSSKIAEGILTQSSRNVPQLTRNGSLAGLTLSRFGVTLTANESCFWLGRTSGRNPFLRCTTLSRTSMSDRSWSALGPSSFRSSVSINLSAPKMARIGLFVTLGGCLPTLNKR